MIKKAILSTLIVSCFAMSLSRILNAYIDKIPVAKMGECVELTTTKGDKVRAYVLNNDSKSNDSILIVKWDKKRISPVLLKYSAMRALKAKKVKCDEIFGS